MSENTELYPRDNIISNDNDDFVTITDPNVKVTLPTLKYGYRTTKSNWDELIQIIEVDYDIPRLSRSRAQQHEYEVFRYHMKQQYRSTVDFILISKFGFDGVLPSVAPNANDEEDLEKKWIAHPCLKDVQTPKTILVKNDFPYSVEDNIVHYVLWKIKEPITQQEILDAREELQSDKIKALEILQWVNPPSLQSIPDIDHVHFLCRLSE
mmetsp:Transcript_4300/g.12328  ORF Transcript_4300/g.12328 Transcript_4300/m.12328 type:complete len:209 (-) Transcript_4300:3099-3725(-)